MATSKELKQLPVEDLQKRATELRETLFNQRIEHKTGVLTSSSAIGKNKSELARVLTILGEKDRAAAGKAPKTTRRRRMAAK